MSALLFEDTSLAIRGRWILSDVRLALERGEFVALVGPNGAGKSMLLRCALGLERPTAGRIMIGSDEVQRLSARARAAQIAWLPQHIVYQEPLTAVEIVATARYRFAERQRNSLAAARRALDEVGAADYADQNVLTLSGGQRQRVALAALLAQGAPLVLVDEPANHLDPMQQIECYRVLGTLVRRNLGVLCVTHDINLLHYVGTDPRVAGLADGRIRFTASYTDDGLPNHLSALFGVHMATGVVDGRRVILPGG